MKGTGANIAIVQGNLINFPTIYPTIENLNEYFHNKA